MTRNKKFGLLASLYIAQGLPFGFFMQSLPALLRKEGADLETIGFGVILALPWALKFLWAPALDKYATRKFWIITANLLAVACMLGLSFMDLSQLVNEGILILIGGFFLMNLFSATQDIATDGLAINQLKESERGIGNGIQVAGYRTGMILGGGLLLAWFSILGWQYSMWILALILFISTVPAILFNDSGHRDEQEQLNISDFIAFIKLPHLGLWLLIILFYKFGDAFSSTMVRPLLIDYGLSIEHIALILGTVGFSAGLIGALTGGILVNLLGRYKALLLFGIIQSVAVASWVIIPMGLLNNWVLYGLSSLEHFAGGLATAALFTIMMDHCRKNCAGSDYTIQSCIVVLMNMIASGLSGISAANFGYAIHFILAGVISLVALPIIYRYRKNLLS